MSLLPWAQWLDGSTLGIAIRDSSILFPIVETFHLLALALLGGALLVVDLRLWGFGTRQPLADVAKDAQPWLLGSLLVMVISGILLFLSEVMKLYESGPFRIKMVCLFFAILFTFTVRRRVTTTASDVTPAYGRMVAAISLMLWLSVGIAGRAIGFL
jgi:hypothetical protein